MKLVNKKILLISPERWGVNRLSKHHYAEILAKRGNQVYFLNPPTKGLLRITISATNINGLELIDYSPFLKGLNRFVRIPWLFNKLCACDTNRIKKLLPTLDIIWSFDPFRFQLPNLLGAPLFIFHPVDYFQSTIDQIVAKNASVIFSVSQFILDRYKGIPTPSFFINHGVGSIYLNQSNVTEEKQDSNIRCGYIGNMLSFGIHWSNLLTIVRTNSAVEFHFIGPYTINNLGDAKEENPSLIELKQCPNTLFYGELSPPEISKKIKLFDLFLICYDPEIVGPVTSNTHKILEYLSTGKVVVSSRISTYDNLANGLFSMVRSSIELPTKFSEVVAKISAYNTPELQQKRKSFAHLNSYENHILEIEKILTELTDNKINQSKSTLSSEGSG